MQIVVSAARPEGSKNWLKLDPGFMALISRHYYEDLTPASLAVGRVVSGRAWWLWKMFFCYYYWEEHLLHREPWIWLFLVMPRDVSRCMIAMCDWRCAVGLAWQSLFLSLAHHDCLQKLSIELQPASLPFTRPRYALDPLPHSAPLSALTATHFLSHALFITTTVLPCPSDPSPSPCSCSV